MEDLISQLDANDEADRAYAAEDIGDGDMGAALDPLIARLDREPSQNVREAIVAALGRLTDPRVAGRMTALFSHRDAFVRNSAVAVLQEKGAAAVHEIGRALFEGNEDVRKLALDALSSIETPLSHELFERALADTDVNVRITAVECIGEHRVSRLRGRVEAMFQAEEHPMMLSALYAALLVVGTEATWVVVVSRYPRVDAVPPYQRGLWLRALGRWGPSSSLEIVCAAAASHPEVAAEDIFGTAKCLDERYSYAHLPLRLVDYFEALTRGEASAVLKHELVEWLASAETRTGGSGEVEAGAQP